MNNYSHESIHSGNCWGFMHKHKFEIISGLLPADWRPSKKLKPEILFGKYTKASALMRHQLSHSICSNYTEENQQNLYQQTHKMNIGFEQWKFISTVSPGKRSANKMWKQADFRALFIQRISKVVAKFGIGGKTSVRAHDNVPWAPGKLTHEWGKRKSKSDSLWKVETHISFSILLAIVVAAVFHSLFVAVRIQNSSCRFSLLHVAYNFDADTRKALQINEEWPLTMAIDSANHIETDCRRLHCDVRCTHWLGLCNVHSPPFPLNAINTFDLNVCCRSAHVTECNRNNDYAIQLRFDRVSDNAYYSAKSLWTTMSISVSICLCRIASEIIKNQLLWSQAHSRKESVWKTTSFPMQNSETLMSEPTHCENANL